MKKPICSFCTVPMEPSGQTLVKPGKPNRYITTVHTCPDCGKLHETPQHIIDNARRPPSEPKPKPKQRVAFKDAMLMFNKIVSEESNVNFATKKMETNLVFIDIEFEKVIRKLTR